MIPNSDTRLVVDCNAKDHGNSSVFHVDMLDNNETWRAKYPGKEWSFDLDEYDIQVYATEAEACAAQRMYRICQGYDPESGEPM